VAGNACAEIGDDVRSEIGGRCAHDVCRSSRQPFRRLAAADDDEDVHWIEVTTKANERGGERPARGSLFDAGRRYGQAMKSGQKAPDFELPDETGTPRKLSGLLAAGPVVLFFYPAAMTYGCTKESCHFRDLNTEFAEVGAQRVGISADKVEKQQQFSQKHSFDFPLLSDPDKAVAGQFGVKRGIGPNKRTTFVIDRDGTVLDVIKSEINMNSHADRALEVLRAHTPQHP